MLQYGGVPVTQGVPVPYRQSILGVYATTVLPGQIGGSDGNPGTFNAPFGTLDYAIGRCTANWGHYFYQTRSC